MSIVVEVQTLVGHPTGQMHWDYGFTRDLGLLQTKNNNI